MSWAVAAGIGAVVLTGGGLALAVVVSPAARADDSESTQAPDHDSSVIGRTFHALAPDGPPIRVVIGDRPAAQP